MPEIRYYTVRQTREVKVSAEHPLAAASLAQGCFDNKIKEGDTFSKINIVGAVRERSIEVHEDY